MKKRIIFGLLLVVVFIGVWYFGIKSYDYKVTFKTPHATGVVYHTLASWNNWEGDLNKAVTTNREVPYSELSQDLNVSDSIININWLIERKSDSVTKVTALLKDTQHSFIQKLQVPFKETDFVKRSLKIVKKIKEDLEFHETEYGVSTIEKSKTSKRFCAYVSFKDELQNKGQQMMKHTAFIMDFIRSNGLKLNGDPFLEVKHWDKEQNQLAFDFCFPIKEQKNLPKTGEIKFKTTKSQESLKMIYNGSYLTSDRAWFTLMDYAKQHRIDIKPLPTEIFLNDPHSGGDELEWRAEVFVPLE